MLWFDTITGLNDDNACAGCHSPTAGFGDTQSIAIGVDSNGIVGPDRAGPRNQRRAPMVLNTAFFPSLMLNNRFSSLSGDPFDPSARGFCFRLPEGTSLSYLPHLLDAQAFIPPTERAEAAGFSFVGDNDAIRAEVVRRLNEAEGYRNLFARVFPEVRRGAPITYEMVARAIAEFEFSLTFANAPIDRYARGEPTALDDREKQGALLFFGELGCVSCHQVSGSSNEMFSDFRDHVIGVPQLAPVRVANVAFDGPGGNEDFGREQFTGERLDRYAFRTSPCAMLRCNPRSCTTARSRASKKLSAITWMSSPRPSPTTRLCRASTPISRARSRRALRCLRGSTRSLRSRRGSRRTNSTRSWRSSVTAYSTRAPAPTRLRHLIPEKLPSDRAPLVFQAP